MRRIFKAPVIILFLLIPLIVFFPANDLHAQNNVLKQFSEGLEKEAEGDCLSAIFIFQDILEINPYFVDAKIALARCLYKSGFLNESETLLRDTIKQERKNVEARNILGQVLISLKKYEEAEEVFKEALNIEPANIKTRYGFADLYRAKGDYTTAIDIYNEILKVYPQEVWTYIYMGTSYTEMGELEKAGGFFRKAVSLDSTSPWTHINLARHYYQMGVKYSGTHSIDSKKFFNAAIYEAKTALEIEKGLPEAYKILTSIYFFNKNWEKAIQANENILKLDDESSLLLYEIGFCYEMIEDIEKAEASYSKALSKRIDDEITRFRLENTVFTLYRQSLSEQKRKDLSEFHHDKARYYLDKNVMNKSYIHYKRAIQLDPLDPVTRREFTELLKIRRYYEQYLYELKNILRDTLDVNTVEINDLIEIYENRVEKNLAAQWSVKQYEEDENIKGFIPKTKTTVTVFNGFHSDYIYENFLHKRLSKTLSEMLSHALSYYPKIEIVPFKNEILTRKDALKNARELGSDYYITGAAEEKEDSLKVRLDLYSSFNGKIEQSFETYFTGNDKVFRTVVALADNINAHIPLRGIIVRMEGDGVLINIGRAHGVTSDMAFNIIREGGLNKNPETGEYITDQDVLLGRLTITNVDEMIAEGEYTYEGLYNRVNVYDNVILIDEDKEK
jgi:tetratricopeptide (TPR) repeat protein